MMASSIVLPTVADTNSWALKASMQTDRSRLGVAAVNGKIYAIGGDSVDLVGNCIGPAYGTPVNTTEEYSPTTDTWVFKKAMPTARCSFATAVFQNKIYCIGGYLTGRTMTGVNEVYDPATDAWQTRTPMPTPRMDLQASVVDGRIYIIGGRRDSDYLGVNEVYDPATDTWSTKTSSPNRITSGASAATDGNIYVLATESLLDTGALIESYNPKDDSWTVDATSPTYGDWSTTACATSTTSGKIVFFSETSTSTYNPSAKSWTNDTAMPTLRGFTGVAYLNNVFYVIGGIKAPFAGYIVITSSVATNEAYQLLNDQPVNFDDKIHIRADGSIEPSTANIVTNDKIHYAFTANNSQRIIIERDNIALNGNGFTLQGSDNYGIAIFGRNNVIIANLTIAQFQGAAIGIEHSKNIIITRNNLIQSLNNGIRTFASSNLTIVGNRILKNRYMSGIQFEDNSNNNLVYGNDIEGNYMGIFLLSSNNNLIYCNNLQNSVNAKLYGDSTNKWHDENSSKGNYWSDYKGVDNDANGIGDTPLAIGENNKDSYPLMTPFDNTKAYIELPDFAVSPNPPNDPRNTETQAQPSEPFEPFPWLHVAAVSAAAATVVAGVAMVYLRKRHTPRQEAIKSA